LSASTSAAAIDFDATARAQAGAILAFLTRYVGDRDTAEDLLQETLIRMQRALPGFEGRSSVRTWSFAIASRVAADYLRHPDRRARIVELDEAAELADAAPGHDAQLVAEDMNDCIRGNIDSLPDRYRSALILHDLEGLSIEQVAEVCACTVATAKIRVHRARRRLRETLDARCDFYRDEDSVFRCDRKPSGAG